MLGVDFRDALCTQACLQRAKNSLTLTPNSVSFFSFTSFLLCGGVWWFPHGLCVWPPDLSSDQMH